jgi:glycosyltransferase involved in cell wall biosynthesis
METLKLLFTSTFYPPYHLGGDAIHVRYLAEELARKGHEVHVVHSLDAYRLKRKGQPAAVEPMPGVHVHPVSSGFGWLSPFWTYVSGISRPAERVIEKIMKEEKLDIVHHHNVSLLGSRMLGAPLPTIYTAHDYWLICPRSDLMYKGEGLCNKRRCLSCSLATGRPPQIWRGAGWRKRLSGLGTVISPSEFMKGQLSSFLGLDSTLIPNFAPMTSSSVVREELEPYAAFVGVLEKWKGLDVILDTFQHRTDLNLRVFGKGSMEQRVRSMEASTSGRVKYLGYLEKQELQNHVAGASCVICTSAVNENCPLSAIESLALGTPLVVNARGGLPELVRGPECGLVADLTPQGLGKAIDAIQGDHQLASRLVANARERYLREYSPEAFMAKYEAILRSSLRTD